MKLSLIMIGIVAASVSSLAVAESFTSAPGQKPMDVIVGNGGGASSASQPQSRPVSPLIHEPRDTAYPNGSNLRVEDHFYGKGGEKLSQDAAELAGRAFLTGKIPDECDPTPAYSAHVARTWMVEYSLNCNGVEVAGNQAKVFISDEGELLSVQTPKIKAVGSNEPASGSLNAAIGAAVADFSGKTRTSNVKTLLPVKVYHVDEQGNAELAWEISVSDSKAPHKARYEYLVSATTPGKILKAESRIYTGSLR